MIPHPKQNSPEHLARIVPNLRPAFEHEIFNENGKFIRTSFFQYCPSCGIIHIVQIVLPTFEKNDATYIRQAKRRAYNEACNYCRALIKEGEIYISTNNIDFIIQLNLN